MLVCQMLVVVLSAVRRLDALVLHTWSSAKDLARSVRGFGSDGETGVAD